MQYKTLDDVVRAMLATFPQATIEEDNGGQLVVYTGLTEKSGKIYEFTPCEQCDGRVFDNVCDDCHYEKPE